MRIESVATGEQALPEMRAARQAGDPYRFILIDSPRCEDGGSVLAEAIHSDPSLNDCAIVTLSALRKCPDVCRTQGEVRDACLSKPVRRTQLFQALANSWAKRQGVTLSGDVRAGPNAADLKPGVAGKFAAYNSRILVVEDNVVNQKVVCRLLERLGLRTDVAANGREAVEMSALVPYGLILMDCQMPEMDGYEATRHIRRREGPARQVAVIALTADAMAGGRERCLEAGMNDYITKPVTMKVVHEALERWLPQEQCSPPRTGRGEGSSAQALSSCDTAHR
jgi:CheY-like chemotaxis protein